MILTQDNWATFASNTNSARRLVLAVVMEFANVHRISWLLLIVDPALVRGQESLDVQAPDFVSLCCLFTVQIEK